MAADLVIQSATEELVNSLDFTLPSTSRYITARRQVKFFPSGASDFSPRGVRTARVLLSGDGGWLDPSSLRLSFKLHNDDPNNKLFLAGGPHVLFDRIRISVGGNIVEDIGPVYGRIHHAFYNILAPQNWIENEAVMNNMMHIDPARYPAHNPVQASPIAPGYYATCTLPIACGLLKSGKMLPIRWAPVMIEATLCDAEFAVATHTAHSSAGNQTELSAGSRAYTIRQLAVHCAQIKLDDAAESKYAEVLLNARALSLPIKTVSCQVQSIPDGSTSFQLSLVRAMSRINAVFVSFTWDVPGPPGNGQVHNQAMTVFANPSNAAPDSGGHPNHTERIMTAQLSIGSKQVPESPISSMGELFDNLQQAVDVYDQSLRTLAITPSQYALDSFIAGFNLAKVPGHYFTGLNSRSGDLTTLRFNNLISGMTNIKVYVFTLHEGISEVREGGVSFYD